MQTEAVETKYQNMSFLLRIKTESSLKLAVNKTYSL